MMKKRIPTIMLFTIVFFLVALSSCTEEKPSSSLTENEFFFREKLATISKDETRQHIYYIGTEDGLVYVYNSESNHIDTLFTAFDRIYKVVRDTIGGKEPSYWVGTRNMGLCLCALISDSLVLRQQYIIPSEGKESKFSTYDIVVLSSGVFAATSHGLFEVDEHSNILSPIYITPQDTVTCRRLSPVVYNQMVYEKNERYLYCASVQGLKKINLNNGDTTTCIPGLVKSISVHGEGIYALTENNEHKDSLKVYCISSETICSAYPLSKLAKQYYFDAIDSIHYFINDNYVELVEDRNIDNLSEHKVIPLHNPIRATTCRNVIVNDSMHRQSLMVTPHTLSLVAHHQNVFNSYGIVSNACVDGKYIYYLIGKRLYRQDISLRISMEACEIKELETSDVNFMEVKDGILYYANSNDELFSAKLYDSYFFNRILSSGEKAKVKFEKAITAIGKDNASIYIGIRDGLRSMSDNIINIDPVQDPFVTAFSLIPDCDSILFSTLNDGIYIGKERFQLISGTKNIQFIRDLTVNEDTLYFLNNRHLYKQYSDSLYIPIRKAQGYNRLFIVDRHHVYGLGDYGITNLMDGTRFFDDIQFNPKACIQVGDRIFLGCAQGVYIVDTLSYDVNGGEIGFQTVTFKNALTLSYIGLAVICLLLLIFVVGLWIRDRYKLSQRALFAYRDRLVDDISELQHIEEFLPLEARVEVSILNERIAAINIAKKKEALNSMKDCRKSLKGMTSKAASSLVLKLQEQKDRIDELKINGHDILNNIDRAVKEHTLSALSDQIEATKLWIEKAEQLRMKYNCLHDAIDRIPEISFITDEVKTTIESDAMIDVKLSLIKQKLTELDKSDYLGSILSYITTKEEECTNKLHDTDQTTIHYTALCMIRDEYQKIRTDTEHHSDLFKLLLQLGESDMHLIMVTCLMSIKKLIQQYQTDSKKLKDIESLIDKNKREGKYVLQGDKSVRMIDEQQKEDKKKRVNEIKAEIIVSINNLYEKWLNNEQKVLNTMGYKAKKSGDQFMNWNVLALLMSGTDVPVSKFNNFIEGSTPRIITAKNDVIRLINSHRVEIHNYIENSSSFSMALYLLDIADANLQ